MPRYSPEIIDEIRSRTNIVDVVSRYVKLTKKGSNYFGLCPFHNEKSGSFSVNPGREMYKCFGCNKAGDVFSFIMEEENMSFPEAVQKLAKECGVDLPEEHVSREELAQRSRKEKLREVNREAALYFYRLLKSSHGQRALDYFHARKLKDETITSWGLGYSDQTSDDLYRYLRSRNIPDDLIRDSGLCTFDERRGWHDKFWNRAMFPIMDVQGRVIGFGGRVMGDGEPKYLNSPETEVFNKSENLFGLNFARRSRRKEFIVCEGYMDVISMHQAGFDNTVASLGTALTEKHCQILKKFKRPIYLSYDSDGAGVRAALRAIELFNAIGVTTRIINMRPYKDPDEFIKALGPDEFEKRISQAENSFLYRVRMMQGEYNLEDPEGKTAFQTMMADLVIREFDTDIERQNYVVELCKIYHMQEDAFRSLISHEASKGVVRQATRQKEEPKPTISKRAAAIRSSDAGRTQTERLLLSWMAERRDVWEAVSPYVSTSDFLEGTRRLLAEAIYAGWANGEQSKAVHFLDRFEEPEDREEVAGIFHMDTDFENPDDWNRALRETVSRVLRDSMKAALDTAPPGDPETFRKTMENKKKLQEIARHDFGISN